MRPYLEALQGEYYLRAGQRERGARLLEEAARKLRAEPGPDAWSQALFWLEAMARAAREAGDWALAARLDQELSVALGLCGHV